MTVQELIRKYHIEDGARYGRPGTLYVPRGKQLTPAVQEEIRARKEEILAELACQAEKRRRLYEEQERRRKEEEEHQKQAIISGEEKIILSYKDGEYLDGWTVYGPAAELLVSLGLARWVEGWGCLVKDEAAKALGREFTYPAAQEFARPALEEKAAKEAARQAKFEEARRTGKPVKLGSYTTECDGSVEDCDLDIVTVWAMPDGTTKETRDHTF